MDQKILWVVNRISKTDDKNLPIMGLEEIAKARTFHKSFPQYTETPLAKLGHMAAYLGVKGTYLKDGSYRSGLNTFRVLDGSFSMARYIAKEAGRDISELPCSVFTSDQLREEFGQAIFFTITNDSHGRDAAWAANRLRQKAMVHIPKGSTQTRLENIAKEGIQVGVQEVNYDDYMCLAAEKADKTPRGIMVQDTVWNGYKEISSWVMQGYGTMAMGAGEQLEEYGCEHPTHVFARADVGSLAGAAVGYLPNLYTDNPPAFVVVEAEAVARLCKGVTAGGGQIRTMDGDIETITVSLACDESNTISWDILKNHVKVSIAALDWVATNGTRMLGAPIKGDTPVAFGESGAAPFDMLVTIVSMNECADLRKNIGLDENSEVLLFSTEGDTDPDRCRNIVWEGLDK